MASRSRRRWMRVGIALAVLAALGALGLRVWPPLGGRPSGARRARIERSPHWSGGAFVNLVPTHTLLPGRTWETVKGHFTGGEQRVPTGVIPVMPLRPEDLATPPPNGLRATWIGHATVLVEIDGLRVLTDPIWSERCSPLGGLGPRRFHPPPLALADLGKVDAAVISHDHYDHLDMETVQALAAGGTRFFVPLGIGAHLDRWGVPSPQVVELDWNERAALGPLTFVALPARHYSGRAPGRSNATLWASWAVVGPAHRFFYSGDTGAFDGFRQVGAAHGPFDLALVKIGAYGDTWPQIHVTPEEAVQLHQDVRGALLFPVHWGTFNLARHRWAEPAERLVKAATGGGVKFVVPRPGQPVDPASPPPLERWWVGR